MGSRISVTLHHLTKIIPSVTLTVMPRLVTLSITPSRYVWNLGFTLAILPNKATFLNRL